MARKLSEKQKDILRKYPNIYDADSISEKDKNALVKLNDYETIWHDANRFLGDQYITEGNKAVSHCCAGFED